MLIGKWQSLLFLTVVFILSINAFEDKIAFLYGVFIGAANLVLSFAFMRWSQREVSRAQGRALVAVIKSMIVRFVVVCNLLLLGLVWFKVNPVSLFLGFVIGQVFYLFNHLIGIVKHGK